ncbi:MAG: diacylglycerol kinase family protein [Nocardioides sp.]
MAERPRLWAAGWAVACFTLFLAVGLLVRSDWWASASLDAEGQAWTAWAARRDWLEVSLRLVEATFGTRGMTVITATVAILLFWRKQRRAAAYAVGVMLATHVTTSGAKVLFGRARPEWQDPVGELISKAYPSGHVSTSAALGGIVLVLASMFLRRAPIRRAVSVAVAAFVVLIAADRILLGRHYLTDTVGGALLGAGFALAGLVVYSPLPRSRAATNRRGAGGAPADRDLAVVVNPAKLEDAVAFRKTVASMANETGWSQPRWYYTTKDDPGAGMAHQAAVEGADLVLVCGGDGTVREVCAELAGTGIPIGIIPAGTGNLLARNLDIPLYLRSAVDVALTGRDRAIDMVGVSGDGFEDTHFMVMAGMGMDAEIMANVNEETKKKIGWFAYVVSGAKSLMSPSIRVEISIDGGPFERHRARTVVVGNVGYIQAGMPLLPDASVDDGELDVVLLHPRSVLSWIPLAARILSKRSRTDDSLKRMTGATVALRTHHETPRQLDGDTIGSGRELLMESIHGRVLVRVPR